MRRLSLFGWIVSISLIFAPNGVCEKPRSHLSRLDIQAKKGPSFIPADLFDQVKNDLELEADDKRLLSLFDPEARAEREKLYEKQALEEAEEAKKARNLIAHLKKSNGGEKVLSNEEVMKPILEKVNKNKEKFLAYERKMAKYQTEKFKKEVLTLKPLRRCTEDKTVPVTRKNVVTAKANVVIADVLFIAPGMRTTSPHEMYGNNPEIVVYDPAKPTQFAYMAKMLNAPCLPFRRRSTGRYQFEHYGERALRNYDGNPNGDGENLFE